MLPRKEYFMSIMSSRDVSFRETGRQRRTSEASVRAAFRTRQV